ncbi:MAG: carboxylating nicotinate-nucleotide diphosphorylase [Ignavibacteriaceae bacterium]|nr:carboxylating nicotinate-nucleotide diphosphorylase [Ignavibacteriaceae bacterium]
MSQIDYIFEIEQLVQRCLVEDIREGDITSEAIFAGDEIATASIIAKEEGVVCGIVVAQKVFEKLDNTVFFQALKKDGDDIKPFEAIIRVSGRVKSLLGAERTALNFMQRLSGIATLSRSFKNLVNQSNITILDTRKTMPGLRYLDKYAVRVGGCENHRYGLFDMYLIKDNHIKAAGSIKNAVDACLKHREVNMYKYKIEVEVADIEQLKEALGCDVDVIMLDNFSPENLKAAVQLVGGKVKLEISGGVTAHNISKYLDSGVDFISIGALTHSVKSMDLSMNIEL